MDKITNKVPHELTIINKNGEHVVYPASKNPIRLQLRKFSFYQKIGEHTFEMTKEGSSDKSIILLMAQLDSIINERGGYVVVSRLAQESLPITYKHLAKILSPGNLVRVNGIVKGAVGFTTREKNNKGKNNDN